MRALVAFLGARHGGSRVDAVDVFTYLYLVLGTALMFGPVLWLVGSSFKTQAALQEFPPSLLPYGQKSAKVEGQERELPLFLVRLPDGTERELAMLRRVGLEGQFLDPAAPGAGLRRVRMENATPSREIRLAGENYRDPLQRFNFLRFLWNSVFVTVVATAITLLINSMCAFALSKYRFKGREAIFLLILSTLMIPITVVMVPAYVVVASLGLTNSLWGVILPAVATPTGVFLLRQYMLTIPDELLEAARMDAASEWRIYWRIILPLTAPALAVLAIFSVMWRWNDFLWPLIVLNREEVFTLQLGLQAFQGDLQTQWHYLLAMTVVALVPVTLVFAFLQRFITTGIASTGLK
jgi:alpha-1,4-digalacturonate transport system permease protein